MTVAEDSAEFLRYTFGHQQDNSADVLAEVSQHNAALMAHAERVREAQKAAEVKPSQQLRTSVAGNASITFKDGRETLTIGGEAKVQAHAQLPAGMVTLPNGMTTTVEAARAAGFDIPAPASFNGGSSDAPQATPNKPEGQPSAAPVEGMTELETAKLELGHATLAIGNEVAGPVVVQALQEDTVVSGELPRELPQGVTQEQVSNVVAGYVAQANAVLRSTGASVDMLTEFLNEGELREARLATYRNDDDKLRTLGGKAMERLVQLPRDPAHLAALTADWPKDVQVTRRDNTVWVKTSAWPQEMKWGDAVRAGLISL